MRADDHRIAGPALAVAGRPKAADQNLPRSMPDKDVLELRQPLRLVQLLPRSAVDLPADTLHVKKEFRLSQAAGFQAQILDMIVPARMLAKSAKEDLLVGARR